MMMVVTTYLSPANGRCRETAHCARESDGLSKFTLIEHFRSNDKVRRICYHNNKDARQTFNHRCKNVNIKIENVKNVKTIIKNVF